MATPVWIAATDQIKAVVTAVAGITSVDQGYARYTDAQNFEEIVASMTPEVQGRFRFNLDEVRYLPLDASVGNWFGELAVFVPKDVSSNMDKAWTLCLQVVNAIGDQANFVNLGIIPRQIVCAFDRIDIIHAGGIAYFTFGRPGSGGIEMVDP